MINKVYGKRQALYFNPMYIPVVLKMLHICSYCDDHNWENSVNLFWLLLTNFVLKYLKTHVSISINNSFIYYHNNKKSL